MKFTELDSIGLLRNLQMGVVVHGADTQILYANSKALELLRLTVEQAIGKDAFDPNWRFWDKHNQVMSFESFPVNQVAATQAPITNLEVGILDSSSNKVTWVLCNAYPEFDEQNHISQIIVTFIDITHQKQQISFEAIVELASDIVVVTEASPITDEGPRIVYVNNAFTKLTGYSKEEVLGKTPRILQGPNTDPETRYKIRTALAQQIPVQAQLLNYSKSGREYWLDMNIVPMKNEYDEVCYFAAVERDITKQKVRENLLKELSVRDSLTSLLNRRGFFEAAQATLTYSKRNTKSVSLAMIDIDHFKKINDNHGHNVGDKVLMHMSQSMTNFFRKSDVIGRMGGEEFCVLLTDSNLDTSIDKMELFRECSEQSPVNLEDGSQVCFTISIGISEVKEGSKFQLEAMIKEADEYLYQAKETGRNKVCFKQAAP